MRLLRFLAPAILIASLAATALAQAPGAKQPPDYAIYDAFFFRVSWFDEMAQKQQARGKDGASLRSAIRRQAGWSLAQEESVKAVAKDCRDKAAALAAAVRAQMATGPATISQAVLDQRKQIILDHVDQLRADLGPADFRKLDFFVRQAIKLKAPGTPSQN